MSCRLDNCFHSQVIAKIPILAYLYMIVTAKMLNSISKDFQFVCKKT